MAYINYQGGSATDMLSGLLGLKDREMTENQNRRQMIYQGIRDAGNVAGNVIGYMKRKGAIQYLGDDKLNEMKRQLAELKTELQSVENEMKTIKAEDIGSLDVNQDLNVPAETDVNAWEVDGGRMATYPVNTPFGTQDASMMKRPGLTAMGGL